MRIALIIKKIVKRNTMFNQVPMVAGAPTI